MKEPVDPNTYVDETASKIDRGVKFVGGKEIFNLAFHCTARDLWPKDYRQAKPEWLSPINEYLFDFCRPIRTIADEIRCVACNQQVTGHHILLQDWRTKNALSYEPHGTKEGRCNSCGYPLRMSHTMYTRDRQQVLVKLDNFPLFYHPASVQRRRS